ncbi:MAG: hypothetical protein OEV74_20890, partial [Cyclobacteriaceae bacterium]|nr:hypothetical protein [Cyclobacteriaceae bacterium]
EDYAAKFGTNYGGGFGGLHSAMASLDAITQDASLFRFSVLGKMYGGVYHTENGIVVSAAIAQVAEDYSGAWVPTSELNIFEFTEQLNNANVSGPGSDFIYDNNNSIGLGLETLENGTTGAIEEVLKNKALYTAGTKIGAKVVGGSVIGLNLGVTFYTIGKELQSNDPKAFNTHSFVNMGVTVLTTGATAIGIIFAGATAPVWVPAVAIGGAAVGIGYGIAQVAGIDQWIDSRYGFK